MAPVLNPGGYSSEALAYAVALRDAYAEAAKGSRSAAPSFGLKQFAEQQNPSFVRGLPDATMAALKSLFSAGVQQRAPWDVAICHATPDVWHADGAFGWGSVEPCPPPGARFSVGRTMYETDRVPEAWVPRINAMDEVWVPSAFAVEQFTSSGVDVAKVVVVPEAVDTDLFDPTRHDPLELPHTGTFRFLSVFKWEKRKGWDILLRAYFEEFSAEDPVSLHLKTQAFHSSSDFEDKVRDFVDTLTTARKPLARYSVSAADLPLRDLPRLYRSAGAFVLPSRGEGWGRPHVEAMAMGLPVIATNWSGSTEFLSDRCALPLRIDGLEEVEDGQGPAGHRWARPSPAHLRELMRWVVEHRDEAGALGASARKEMVARFSPEAVVRDHVLPRLRLIKGRVARGRRRGRASAEL